VHRPEKAGDLAPFFLAAPPTLNKRAGIAGR